MKADQPLLTIAIPTFSRALYLRELLSCLFVELSNQPSVELLISDNASTDNTAEVIGEFQNLGMTIEYLRNGENIGPDPNFRQCFEKAKGKFVWILGDDDLLVPGAVAKIVFLLKKGDFSLVFVSPYHFRKDYLAERTTDRFGRLAQVLPSGLPLARKAGAMIGFLSAIIANKNLFLSIPHEPLAKYAGTNLMQIGWVCPLLAANAKTLFVWDRLVAARSGNAGGWGACQVFGVNFKRITDTALEAKIEIAEALQASTLQRWLPDVIMQIRRGDQNTLEDEDFRAILEPIYKSNWRYWTYVLPLIVLPVSAAGLWFELVLFSRRFEVLVSMITDSTFSKSCLIRPPA